MASITNFHKGKYYSYAILVNEDGLVFAKHEHHRANNQEWYIYENDLNNIVEYCSTETSFRPLFGKFSLYHLPGNYQHDETGANQRDHCCTECFRYSKVMLPRL